jgi:hypothetical protein
VIAPVLAAIVAAFVAGHPTQIVCDADVNRSPTPAPPGFVATAWTAVGGNVIHMIPARCAGLEAKPGNGEFARSLGTLIHEASIARGVRTEQCANLWTALLPFEVLERYYDVPMGSPLSWSVAGQVLGHVLDGPPEYRPQLTSCEIQPH